jgi:amidohydrolase
VTADLLAAAQDLQDQLIAWRREIHQHPELSFQEHRTAGLVASTLRDVGLAVETGVGKTGVVGRLGAGKPAIGLRADMDALEIQEANDVPYASQNPGVMHACGHDAHTAMLLGAAALLTDLSDRPPGEIRFLFQPSEESWDEEGKGGAKRMIEDGALDGLDAIVALHVDSTQTSGTVGIRSGYTWAGVDPYDATIRGISSHSAAPQQGVNPIVLLARVINTIQAIPALHTDPLQPAIISCEAVRGGSSSGVIPEEVSLHGNIRYYDQETRQALRQALAKALDTVQMWGGDYELAVRGTYPPTYNNPELTAMVRDCAVDVVGESRVWQADRSLAGEDFGAMSSRVPGTYLKLGVQLAGEHRPYHNPRFDLDESALPVGSAVLAASALRFLRKAENPSKPGHASSNERNYDI